MKTIRLNEALARIGILCEDNRIIRGIHEDSRRIKKDWIFLARTPRGERYIAQALAKGAIVLSECQETKKDVYHVDDMDVAMNELLTFCYPSFCEDLLCIAVTGTNGKSSTAYFLYQCLSKQMRCLWIGTHQVLADTFHETIDNTTPNSCELLRLIEKAKEQGISCMIMEVSSHAIAQNRICALSYDFIIYTNIRSDHLDFHICEAHYRYTKYALRRYLKAHGRILVNHDDMRLHPLYLLLDGQCVSYGQALSHFWLHDVIADVNGLHFSVNDQSFDTEVCGRFQALNLTAVIAVCHLCRMEETQIVSAIRQLQPLAGRLQKVWEHPFAFIDYAHTASACAALFASVRSFPHNRIITVIGCGGERDKEKRAQMGKIASMNSDLCIFTSDNPRNEPLAQIFEMMCEQVKDNVMIIEERACAIKFAVKNSTNDDIILVVGKGDECWQIIGGRAYPFDDAEVLCHALREKEELA